MFALRPYFHPDFTQDVFVNAPDATFEPAEADGVAPENFIYLGDSDVDMFCARAAGMHPVGVTWGFREAQELRQAGAERLIDHPMDLFV